MSTVLIVPVEGPLQVEASDLPIDVEALLRTMAEGAYVDFGMEGHPRMGFLLSEGPDVVNIYARSILAWLTGVHVVVTGPAVFSGLSDERLQALLARWA